MHLLKSRSRSIVIVSILPILVIATFGVAQDKPLTLEDIMQFREIQDAAISRDGRWVVYTAQPDRGDGEAVVCSTGDRPGRVIPRGDDPVLSDDGRWVAAALRPEAAAGKKKDDAAKPGLVLLSTDTGDTTCFRRVKQYAFSADSRWLAFLRHPPEPYTGKQIDKGAGSDLVLYAPGQGVTQTVAFVTEFAFDSTGTLLALCVRDTSGKSNGLYTISLHDEEAVPTAAETAERRLFSGLSWNHRDRLLACLISETDDDFEPESSRILIWNGGRQREEAVISAEPAVPDWIVYHRNRLQWSADGQRLFFGIKPRSEIGEPEQTAEDTAAADPYDVERILHERGVDVWHWNDDYINPQQKKMWSREQHRTYTAVWHRASGRTVQLADLDLPGVSVPRNSSVALATSDIPYRKQMTWYGGLEDVYTVHLASGERTAVAEGLEFGAQLSPGGRFVVYYRDRAWYAFDVKRGVTRNLAADLDVPFFDEDHDYPSPAPGYGVAGWTEGDRDVLIYDKYDIWLFPLTGGRPVNITGGAGRAQDYTFRIVRTDPERPTLNSREPLLLSAYHNHHKQYGFYRCIPSSPGVTQLLEDQKKYGFIARAAAADRYLFTRESYREFPDLHTADPGFSSVRRLSDVNPQISEFAWGTAELVEWESLDGIPLQGVLIKPGNYEEGKRYPVLVYYYRFFSQRLHEFNQMVINHRPNFPFYASNGYAVFLPDIRFEVGLPDRPPPSAWSPVCRN
ncbi:S9 family peptidase [bacterium]|nr:S9 family peptidase [bacterium]